jgi:ferric iron reductase protein FhuF
MAMAVGDAVGHDGEMSAFVQRLEGLLETYLPELQADIGLTAGTPEVAESPPADEALDEVLARFAQAYPDADWRAVVSVWSQWYLRTLWPPLMTAALGQARLPEASAVDVRLTPDARPALIRVAEGGLVTGTTDELLEQLVRIHTAPVIGRLAAAGGFSPRVLWNAVGAMVRWTLTTLDERSVDFPLAAGERLLDHEAFPDQAANPLCGTRRRGASQQRRVCCLRYRIEAMPYCADCPIAGCGR